MKVDSRLGDGQAQAAALGAAADHRKENTVHEIFGYPRAVVRNVNSAHDLVMCFADGELTLYSRPEFDHRPLLRAIAQGLYRIADDIEHCLDQLSTITTDFGNTGIIIAFYLNAATGLRLGEHGDMLKNFVNVYR